MRLQIIALEFKMINKKRGERESECESEREIKRERNSTCFDVEF